MQASNVDVDEVMEEWKGWKNVNVAHQWKLFWNDNWRAEGDGFETFKKALISVHDGKGWNSETNEEAHDETKSKAYPVMGVYKFPAADNIKRIKLLAFGYCDDRKAMGGGLKTGRKKMSFASMTNSAKEEWFEGLKGPSVKQWSSEGDITEDNMLAWFMDGDRV